MSEFYVPTGAEFDEGLPAAAPPPRKRKREEQPPTADEAAEAVHAFELVVEPNVDTRRRRRW